MESDQIADFAFFLGDLNYRLNTTFAELNNQNTLEALQMVHTDSEQLAQSLKEGNYPNYIEPRIKFLPSYKMEFNDSLYKDKKNQAPSYTDRILFKNNSSLEVTDEQYACLHDVFGSDHRPVQRSLTIKNFKQPDFADIRKLLDTNNPIQGFG